MIPDWMKQSPSGPPPRDRSAFVRRSLRSLGGVLARLRVQRGREGRLRLPAPAKLLLLLAFLVTVSVTRQRLVLLGAAALALGALCLLPAELIPSVLASALGAAGLSLLLFLPAMLLRPAGIGSHLTVVGKVFLSVTAVNLFNRRTQWNRITAALRSLRVPGVFVFLLDLTLKYIVLLGSLLEQLLTALELRTVGRQRRKYRSVGGVLGVTFLRASELSRETYEAMVCRAFTDDYKGL